MAANKAYKSRFVRVIITALTVCSLLLSFCLISVSAAEKMISRHVSLPAQETRLAWKLAAAEFVADTLLEEFLAAGTGNS